MHRRASGEAVTTDRRIGKDYYDSEYFEAGKEHLLDPGSPFQRYRVRKVLDIHRPGASDAVVDLGCGWGTFTFALAPQVGEVVGVDFSEKSIELCRQRLAGRALSSVRFLCADAGDTGLDAGAFDVVVAADLFEHLYPDDSARVVREAYRLLRPGGRLLVWTPHAGHLIEVLKERGIVGSPDPSHVDYKSMRAMRALLTDAGFEIERAYYVESHLPVLRLIERVLMRAVPFLRRRIAVLGRKPGA